MEDIAALKEVELPTILHVIKNKNQEYFIVCFGYENGKFKIGDPSWGILDMEENELEAIWQLKTLLTLGPTDKFVRQDTAQKSKIHFFYQV